MTTEKRYFIDPSGLKAFYVDKDPKVRAIVKDLLERNVPIYLSDFIIQVFIQHLVVDGKDLMKIKAELKKVQMADGFKMVESLDVTEFTNTKTRFETLENDRITLLEWAVLENMRKCGCATLISGGRGYRGLGGLPGRLAGDYQHIEILPKYA